VGGGILRKRTEYYSQQQNVEKTEAKYWTKQRQNIVGMADECYTVGREYFGQQCMTEYWKRILQNIGQADRPH
jgi:hypothetical protein